MPPAELGAGDDPGVLVEPALDVRARLRALGEPGLEVPGAGRERDLVERLLRRAGELKAAGRVFCTTGLSFFSFGFAWGLSVGLAADLTAGLVTGVTGTVAAARFASLIVVPR